MHPRAEQLIRELALQAHPEGGFYRRQFTSSHVDEARRPCCSAILFLLPAGMVSRWHRIDADEVWHFHEGAPLELLIADSEQSVRRESLGPVEPGQLPQRVVPANAWQAARSLGDFTLAGCTVAPEFRFEHFSLLDDEVDAQAAWPALLRDYAEFL